MKGSGRAFCAGGDVVGSFFFFLRKLSFIFLAVSDSYKAGTSLCTDFFVKEYELNRLIRTLKVPFVALIHGITMGGVSYYILITIK